MGTTAPFGRGSDAFWGRDRQELIRLQASADAAAVEATSAVEATAGEAAGLAPMPSRTRPAVGRSGTCPTLPATPAGSLGRMTCSTLFDGASGFDGGGTADECSQVDTSSRNRTVGFAQPGAAPAWRFEECGLRIAGARVRGGRGRPPHGTGYRPEDCTTDAE